MLKKPLLLLSLVAACTLAQAQSTPAKKALVERILKVQQAGIEQLARDLAKQPANELLGSAIEFVQTQVPADKREAMAKGLQEDGDKYLADAYPLVRERALKLAPTTVGALLEEKFTEDELKQVAVMLEAPVYLKFQGLGGDMQRALVNKLVPELKPQMEPKLRALDAAIAKRLGVQAALGGNGGASAPGAAAPVAPAAPAARPAPKK
ncbi:hypothetical protein LZ009_12750 [Ramlibacter sp. XY19]|uniref:hypothetical protein n=1 Tax=Ramlibacter paludis TaxID=2908000 RepID=UPI0023DCC7C8|nr:hypothetical protein [Ramlibacter paludis]MCG2593648.1 hypothetical protein [Ramlibacter paludis]